jgi:hypothetical protein
MKPDREKPAGWTPAGFLHPGRNGPRNLFPLYVFIHTLVYRISPHSAP